MQKLPNDLESNKLSVEYSEIKNECLTKGITEDRVFNIKRELVVANDENYSTINRKIQKEIESITSKKVADLEKSLDVILDLVERTQSREGMLINVVYELRERIPELQQNNQLMSKFDNFMKTHEPTLSELTSIVKSVKKEFLKNQDGR